MLRILLFFLLSSSFLTAQLEEKPFNSEYRFPDGVYLSHTALLAGQPDLPWESIDGEMVQLPEDYRVQIADYGYKDDRINPDIIPYALSLDGLIYLYVRKDEVRHFHEFAGLRIMGALSTVKYDTIIHTRQLMKAYNPVNGQPFREAWVERNKKLPVNKVLHLRSGALLPLTRETLIRLCADDEALTKALRSTDADDEKMLLRALGLYDDRHPVYLPIR